MAKPINYSKWDHIEISDDEDDTHPNIDTPSLFRWRHEARMQRMEEQKQKREIIEQSKEDNQKKRQEIQQKIKEAENIKTGGEKVVEKAPNDAGVDVQKLKIEASELEKQAKEWKKKEDELTKEERLTPWNIDTMCQEGKSRTQINKVEKTKKDEELTDEEKAERMVAFVKENKKLVEQFGMLRRYEDSQEFLTNHRDLVCEETANQLVIWCINLECEEKHELMKHVSHQTIVIQFILQLAQSLDVNPKDCVRPFFSRIKQAEKQYMAAFNDELEAFRTRVKKRAQERIAEAVAEVEEEERQKRLGPGGLDPVEVYETLPDELKNCFESKDIGMLQECIAKMKPEDATYHMKRCVDSGLWVPGGGESTGLAEGAPEEEEIYEDAPEPTS